MKPETVLLLRKLAREATIFALLGMAVAGIGVFVVLDNEDRTNAKRQAAIAVHAGDANVQLPKGYEDAQPVAQANTVQVPLTNGTILQVRRCETEGPWMKYQPKPKFDPNAPFTAPDCRTFSEGYYERLAKQFGGYLTGVPLGNADQVAIEKDYWTAYKEARHHDPSETLFGILFVSLLGFPAGLVLWFFYRLVRFAVKG